MRKKSSLKNPFQHKQLPFDFHDSYTAKHWTRKIISTHFKLKIAVCSKQGILSGLDFEELLQLRKGCRNSHVSPVDIVSSLCLYYFCQLYLCQLVFCWLVRFLGQLFVSQVFSFLLYSSGCRLWLLSIYMAGCNMVYKTIHSIQYKLFSIIYSPETFFIL